MQHDRHLVPGLVHLAAVDALDGEHVEDDGVPVDGHLFGGDAQHRDPGAVAHVGDHVAEGGGVAGHLQAHVEALGHSELLLHFRETGFAHVDGERYAQLAGERQAVRIDIGDHGVARAGVPRHGRRHDADGAGAGDQHVLAQHGEGKRGVDGVAEGVEDGRDVERNRFVVAPDVGHGQRDVFGERARTVYPHALGVSAQVAAAGEAIAAQAADHVAFPADQVAGEEVHHVGPGLDDPADELVTDRHGHGDGLLRPLVPPVDVHVGAANARAQHLDEHVVDADFGDVHFPEPEARLAPALHQCSHAFTIATSGGASGCVGLRHGQPEPRLRLRGMSRQRNTKEVLLISIRELDGGSERCQQILKVIFGAL